MFLKNEIINNGWTPVSDFKLPHQAKVEMSQERREQLARSGSADAQKWKTAAVKPDYDTMTVEVEKTKVGTNST